MSVVQREQSVVLSVPSLLSSESEESSSEISSKLYFLLGPEHLLKLHPVVKYKYVVCEHLEVIDLTYFEGGVPLP